MKVLVLGDAIYDLYRKFTASRLCPEAPVPIGVNEKKFGTPGGAGLVAEQFTALTDDNTSALLITGSYSTKERIFLDDHIIVRLDDDSNQVMNPGEYLSAVESHMASYKPDAIIVSDYGKGSFIQPAAEWLVRRADDLNIPVFVDAKNNFNWYSGAFAAFPNEKEISGVGTGFKHVIHKQGANGCSVDGAHIPTNSHPVRDVTGAGDVFLAAFVYDYLQKRYWEGTIVERPRHEQDRLECAAQFANKVAGISVEFVGTHVVSLDEIREP